MAVLVGKFGSEAVLNDCSGMNQNEKKLKLTKFFLVFYRLTIPNFIKN